MVVNNLRASLVCRPALSYTHLRALLFILHMLTNLLCSIGHGGKLCSYTLRTITVVAQSELLPVLLGTRLR